MRICIWCIAVVVTLPILCSASVIQTETRITGPSEEYRRELLNSFIPDKSSEFAERVQVGYDKRTAEAGLAMVDELALLWHKYKKDPDLATTPRRGQVEIAYGFAWQDVIDTWHRTSDAKVKSLILKAWDESVLQKDPWLTKHQIVTLVYVWDPAFFTPTLTKHFAETGEYPIICGVAVVAGDHGKEQEEVLLRTKLESLADTVDPESVYYRSSVQAIETTIEKIERWKAGGSRVGPARIVTPEDTQNP